MSRSGYTDDVDPLDLGRWRGQVASAIRGKRGQAFLREMLAALDAMPEKRLVQHEFEVNGDVCALGCVARTRGLDTSAWDPEAVYGFGSIFGIADQMAREVMYWNDEGGWMYADETPEQRWERMRRWVERQIAKDAE